MASNIDLQNVFFLAIGAIPGYLYLHIVSRYILGRALSLSRRTIVFIGGIVFSLCIALVFDKVFVPWFFDLFKMCSDSIYIQYAEHLKVRRVFDIFFASMNDGKGNFSDVSFDFFTLVFSLNVVALIMGIATSVFVKVSRYFASLHPLTPIIFIIIILDTCDALLIKKIIKPKWIEFKISWKVRYYLELAIAVVFVLLFFALSIFVFLISLLSSLISNMVLGLFKIFTSQWFDILNNRTLFAGTAIFEVLNKNGDLFRGNFCRAILNSDQEAIQSMTLSNVIIYRKEDGAQFFDRETRKAFRFSSAKSSLTILFSEVVNFNIWYLTFDSKHWIFEVNSKSSVDNHIWFFDQIISSYKPFFSLTDFEVKAKDKFAFVFLSEIADLIQKYYFSSSYTKLLYYGKNRELRRQLIKVTRSYVHELRRKQASGVEIPEDVSEELKKLINKIKNLKNIKII